MSSCRVFVSSRCVNSAFVFGAVDGVSAALSGTSCGGQTLIAVGWGCSQLGVIIHVQPSNATLQQKVGHSKDEQRLCVKMNYM